MHTVYLPPFFTEKLVCICWKFFVISSCFRSTAYHQLAVLLLSGESKKFTVYYIIIVYFSTVAITDKIANPGHLNFTSTTTLPSLDPLMMQSSPSHPI